MRSRLKTDARSIEHQSHLISIRIGLTAIVCHVIHLRPKDGKVVEILSSSIADDLHTVGRTEVCTDVATSQTVVASTHGQRLHINVTRGVVFLVEHGNYAVLSHAIEEEMEWRNGIRGDAHFFRGLIDRCIAEMGFHAQGVERIVYHAGTHEHRVVAHDEVVFSSHMVFVDTVKIDGLAPCIAIVDGEHEVATHGVVVECVVGHFLLERQQVATLPHAGGFAIVLYSHHRLAVHKTVVGGDEVFLPLSSLRVLDGRGKEGACRELIVLLNGCFCCDLVSINEACKFLIHHYLVFTALRTHVARGGLIRLRDVNGRVVIDVQKGHTVVVVIGGVLQVIVHHMVLVKEVGVGIGCHVGNQRLAKGGGAEQRQTAVALGHRLGTVFLGDPPRIILMEGVVVVVIGKELFVTPCKACTSCPVEDKRVDVSIGFQSSYDEKEASVVGCLRLEGSCQSVT